MSRRALFVWMLALITAWPLVHIASKLSLLHQLGVLDADLALDLFQPVLAPLALVLLLNIRSYRFLDWLPLLVLGLAFWPLAVMVGAMGFRLITGPIEVVGGLTIQALTLPFVTLGGYFFGFYRWDFAQAWARHRERVGLPRVRTGEGEGALDLAHLPEQPHLFLLDEGGTLDPGLFGTGEDWRGLEDVVVVGASDRGLTLPAPVPIRWLADRRFIRAFGTRMRSRLRFLLRSGIPWHRPTVVLVDRHGDVVGAAHALGAWEGPLPARVRQWLGR